MLALAIAAFALEADSSFADPVGAFVADLGLSTVLGVVFGVALAVTVSTRRAGIWRESPVLAVLLVLSVGYFSIDWAGGSGYLGAFSPA